MAHFKLSVWLATYRLGHQHTNAPDLSGLERLTWISWELFGRDLWRERGIHIESHVIHLQLVRDLF